ncbi:MAG: HAD family hydrolase [Cyanobacteria bacterium RU_5_0]|nr:HAD family hydrolase [Cyanobacteria bacterium RU_5_0]
MATIRCKDVMFQNIQAVVFDKDGTLANSELFLRNLAQRRSRLIDAQIPGVQDPLLMAFGVTGDQINPAGLMVVGTRHENEVAAAAYVAETGRDWVESMQIVRSAFAEADKFMQRKAEYTPLVEGALDLLQTLSKAGLSLGILSADSTENVKDFVQQYSLDPFIRCQMGVNNYLSKAEPSLLQRVFASLGAFPEQTLMVGDSQVDIQIARATEMTGCIGFTGGWSGSTRLTQADALISQFGDIEVIE